MSASVLIVDDDDDLRELLREQLEATGRYSATTARDATEALAVLGDSPIDVVVSDLRMPGTTGTELCDEIVRLRPDIPVVIMTAFGSLDAAVDAIRAGAYDFLSKPFEPERLEVVIDRAVRERTLRDEVQALRRRTGDVPGYAGMIGTSPAMERLYGLVDRVAASEASVLISGESGVGKELIARALHDKSRRAGGPFVAVNCAALPEALLEDELFGHERGAFTDARQARLGLLREAQGGTVLLDEIGDLSLSLQPKLLRALQERRVRPVGGDEEVRVDVRVIAASHRDLRTEVEAGRFRSDLYYRLAVITIDVPPLRDRGDDVLVLAERFLDELGVREGREPPELPDDVARRLLDYGWPGNVRELQNCMERLWTLSGGETICLEHLPPDLQADESRGAAAGTEPPAFSSLFDVERRHILRVLAACDGNKSQAARILGIDRKTLHARLVRYGRG